MQIKNFGLLKILTLFAYSFYFLLNLFECYICYIGKYIIYDITFDPTFISFTLVPLIISGVYFFLLLKHYFFPIHIIFYVLSPSRWPSLTWCVPLMMTFGSLSSVVVSSRPAWPPLPVTWEGSLAGPVVVSSREAPEPGLASWLGAAGAGVRVSSRPPPPPYLRCVRLAR